MLGNSGCILKFDHDKQVVSKVAANYPVARLYKQYTKAKYFVSPHKNIKSPRVREWTSYGAFKMDMIDGCTFIEFAKLHTIEELNMYADILFEFISYELENCDQYYTVNGQLLDKMDQIKPFLVKEDFQTICDLIEKKKIQLPIGNCHGDLTFANMVFKPDEIFFLDFLDSFIDSPVMDIVKLQQDTIYRWSPFLVSIKYEKVDKWFHYLNTLLSQFSKEDWYNSSILHVINLCRILPYSQKNDRILGYLYSCIQQTLSFGQSTENKSDFLVLDLNGY
jgi:hypothetical protein